MTQTVTRGMFREAFKQTRPNNFTSEGLDALYDWLEEYGDEADDGLYELDVIALCCGYTEFQDIAEFQESYDAGQYETLDDIRDSTTVIEIPDADRFIIQLF